MEAVDALLARLAVLDDQVPMTSDQRYRLERWARLVELARALDVASIAFAAAMSAVVAGGVGLFAGHVAGEARGAARVAAEAAK